MLIVVSLDPPSMTTVSRPLISKYDLTPMDSTWDGMMTFVISVNPKM